MEPEKASFDSPDIQQLLESILKGFLQAIHHESTQSVQAKALEHDGPGSILKSIKSILQQTWTSKSVDTAELLLSLAVASRDLSVRPLLGRCLKHGVGSRTKSTADSSEESILGYVLGSIIKAHGQEGDPKVLENALRLLSNCVADTNCNRKLVLQQDGINTLRHLAKGQQAVNLIIPALYNLCVEYEDPDLKHRDIGLTASRANPAQIELAHSGDQKGVMSDLINMIQGIEPVQDDRKALLAGLIEMVSLTLPEDTICIGLESGMGSEPRKLAITQVLWRLLGVDGYSLAFHSGETAISICTALLNVLAIEEVKTIVVSEKWMQDLASFNHILAAHEKELIDDEAEAETVAGLRQCQKLLLREHYTLSGQLEFAQTYTIDSDFMQVCIDRPRDRRLWAYDPSPTTPSLSIAYTVLANITVSEETAVKLVHNYKVHEPLQGILRELEDIDLLYPALGFLCRLTLPAANRQELINCGILDGIRRFLTPTGGTAMEFKPALRIEALTSFRRLISHIKTDLNDCFRDILSLFVTSNDASTKLEIGRVCVEYFRTISATRGEPPTQPASFSQHNLVEPIAFLACEGPTPATKAEGWFGLGLMTFFKPDQVREVLQNEKVLEEISRLATAQEKAEETSRDNLKMVLNKLDLTDIEEHARDVFLETRSKLGLSG